MNSETIKQKISAHTLVCGTIGLGYVGLPLAVEKAKAGFRTIGFDVQAEKVDMVNRGENYIGDVVQEDLTALVECGMLEATTDFSRVTECDFVAICVPTPLDAHQQPDTSYMEISACEVAPYLKEGAMVVLESTTYPGTTEELIKPILEAGSSMKCGEGFYLGFSPERVDPGNLIYKTKNTPKVVGAIGEEALDLIASVYEAVLEGGVTRVSSPAVAEMEKILENTYRNVNIGLVNEMAMLCDRMGIDVWEVIDAAKTKPYGFTAFYPGPGLGGHCIPLDPYYLSWKAREYGFHTSMIEASMTVNDGMPEWVASRVARILNREGKAVKDSRVLVLGVAYKQDIDDYRESPALRVIERLEVRGARVSYFDPWVPRYCYKGTENHSLPHLTAEAIASADIVLVTCAHTNVDYALVQRHAKAILDTKNAMKDVFPCDNIEVL
ncbi:nucleotide sugar dehydrogenase [Rubneribacter sp.]|nr:nucleotide sugar dehydrogenase [Candidatus Rubneribacter avistercoris]